MGGTGYVISPGHAVPYVRDGVPGLSMDRQEEILLEAGVDMACVFRDCLGDVQLSSRNPLSLVARARMLSGMSAQDGITMHLASLRVLGWTMGDIVSVLASVASTGASIRVHDLCREFHLRPTDVGLMEALAQAEETRRRAQTQAARAVGVQAAADAKEGRRTARLQEAWALWHLSGSQATVAQIGTRVGLSASTLKRHLGSRGKARKDVGERNGGE